MFNLVNLNTFIKYNENILSDYKAIENKINKKNLPLILKFIIFFIPLLPLSISKIIKNEISYKIKGKGMQIILNNNNMKKPDEVIINGIKQEEREYNFNYNLTEEVNDIIISWNTSLTSCKELFINFGNIISVNFSNFDSSKVTDMSKMLHGLNNLKTLDLTNFNTSLVTNMENLFYDCGITSLNLSHFDTSLVTNMRYMFYDCFNLKILDISNFNTSSVKDMESMFYNNIALISLDLSSFNISSVLSMRNMFSNSISLIYLNLKSFVEREGVDILNFISNDMYNLICCIKKENNSNIYNMLEKNGIKNDCENICFSESKKIIIEKNKCIDKCINDENYTYELNGICIGSCPNLADSNKICISEESPKTDNSESINIIKKTEKIIIIEDLNTENITKNFSSENFFKEPHIINNEISKDDIIQNIKNDIIKGNLNKLLKNVTEKNEDLLVQGNDILYQITTTENQKNENNNISTLNLGDCEDKLKEIYGINKNLSLIILKVDYFKQGLLIPVIGYEVFDPINKSELNLTYCNNSLVKLNIPVSINEDALYKYNPNDDYYNDECYTYTTENGTDIIIIDRQNEFKDNKLSLCENNCTYNGYNKGTKKALCECETKLKIDSIEDIINDDNILLNDFKGKNNTLNINTIKCINTLFSKNGLLKNIGSYLLLATIALFSINAVIFGKCGYQIIDQEIREILSSKNVFKGRSKKRHKTNIVDKKIAKTFVRSKKKKNTVAEPTKKKSKKFSTIDIPKERSHSKIELKNTNILILEKNKYEEKIRKKIKYKDYELNELNYFNALLIDKRKFWQYYLSLLKIKNIILFAFYPIDDYNLKIIKISLFSLSFDIFFSVNTFFFDTNAIHQIYKDEGKYNFSYFFPKILYSFLISYFFISFIKYFSLSDRNFIEIKNEENMNKINDKAQNVRRCLLIKYILFFLISFLFLILFWFYLSSFCAVFKNTQIYVVINTFISFAIFLLFPIIFNLLPCAFRIYSLKKRNNKCIFKISKFLQLV